MLATPHTFDPSKPPAIQSRLAEKVVAISNQQRNFERTARRAAMPPLFVRVMTECGEGPISLGRRGVEPLLAVDLPPRREAIDNGLIRTRTAPIRYMMLFEPLACGPTP
jgi:hypothetical protein